MWYALLAVAELLLVGPGGRAQKLDPLVAVFSGFDASDVEVDQIVPALRFLVQSLQLRERVLVHRVDGEYAAECACRTVLVAHFALPELGDRDELANLLLRVDKRLCPLLHDIDRVFPFVLITMDELERVERFEEGGIDRQNVAIGLDRIARLLELVPVNVAELHVDGDEVGVLEGRRADVDDPLQAVGTLSRLTTGVVNLGDAEQGVRVARVDVEHALPVLNRVAIPLQLLVPHPREVGVHLNAERIVVCNRRLALENVDEVPPVALRRVDVAERVQRLGVFPPKVEDSLPQPDGLLWVAQPVRRQLGHACKHIGLLGVTERNAQLLLEAREELRPTLEVGIDAL